MLWECHHCLLQVPITLLASKDVASQHSSAPVCKQGEKEEQGEEGATQGWTLGISGSSKALPKCPEAIWWVGVLQGLFHCLDSSSSTRAGVFAQSESQAGGTGKPDGDRVLAVPLTQTTFLRPKTPEMGHSSPCLASWALMQQHFQHLFLCRARAEAGL